MLSTDNYWQALLCLKNMPRTPRPSKHDLEPLRSQRLGIARGPRFVLLSVFGLFVCVMLLWMATPEDFW